MLNTGKVIPVKKCNGERVIQAKLHKISEFKKFILLNLQVCGNFEHFF